MNCGVAFNRPPGGRSPENRRPSMELEFRQLDEGNARAILRWSYAPPLDFYNAAGDMHALPAMLDRSQRCFAALASGEPIRVRA